MATLPDKPSELIRVALADLRKCEAEPEKYRIDMGEWYVRNGKCTVCLAGAVLAQRLDGPPCDEDGYLESEKLPNDLWCAMEALNELRMGNVYRATYLLGVPITPEAAAIDCRYYGRYDRNDPQKFYETMERLAADLEAAGL